jgi:hypothetical protein
MTRVFCALALIFCSPLIFCQNNGKSFTVKKINQAVTVDGVLDESFWENSDSADNFQQYFPADSVLAEQTTELKMFYDETTLYIGMIVKGAGNDWVIPSLKRDFRAGGSDSITLMFDTFNDGTNAFLFGINPYGVRREALISGGGKDLRGFTTSWDVKWRGDAKIYDGYYTAEMAIPLTSFKFKEGTEKWRFQSYRFDNQTNERSVWFPVPQNQLIFSLAFMGDMHFEEPLGKSRTPLALIPYINAISEKDFISDIGNTNVKVGGDAKVAIGNGMNLDVTINPDFSNVEVDNIITNLTRFEIGLPERRQFFIDNSDLFGNFGGSRDANPFFSRRIGIARDTLDNPIENRILGGVRLSGKLDENWRLGFFSIQTDEDLDNKIASNNNSMFVLQRKVFSRSNISTFFINRQSLKDYDFVEREDEYNRVVGIDYDLASADNKWIGKFYAHKSFQPDDDRGNLSLGAFAGRFSRHFNAFVDLVQVDEDFNSDLGFIRRKGINKSATSLEWLIWPKSETFNNFSFQTFNNVTWQPDFDNQLEGLNNSISDFNNNFSFSGELKNQSQFAIGYRNSFIYLTKNFDPTGVDGAVPLPGNKGYHTNSINARYNSNRAQVFSYSMEAEKGRFFEGDITRFSGQFSLRLQPKAVISMRFNYNDIKLPSPYSNAKIWFISPRVELTFSKSLFWTTLIQYGNQDDNLGINSRLQWRFAPLSDLFIVYNDNYFVDQFSPRFRSINLKLTYWLNI